MLGVNLFYGNRDRQMSWIYVDDCVRGILEAAAHAPSSRNTQPWAVAVLTGRAKDDLAAKLCDAFDLPIYAQGGIGPHTAAACAVGGAAGVVLDSQLALVREYVDRPPSPSHLCRLATSVDQQGTQRLQRLEQKTIESSPT